MNETKKKLDEMVSIFHQGLDIAKQLNAPADRIAAALSAIGGLADPTVYANNVKSGGGPESLPVVDWSLQRQAEIVRQYELRRRGFQPS